MNPDSQAEIRTLLSERGLALKKRWGQNFMVNRGARERLVSLLGLTGKELAWEIGPGLGSMTGLLLDGAASVIAFEVDRGLAAYLAERFASTPALNVVQGDFLDTWRSIRDSRGVPHGVLGNLPYRSASIMIADLIEGGLRPARMVFTVQKELAERMASRPGVKSYSSFSVLCQACFEVTGQGDLKPGSFYPVPEVVSSIVVMTPRGDAPEGRQLAALSTLARGLFAARRKTIRNNIVSGSFRDTTLAPAVLGALEGEGIDPGRRAEELAPETFVRLARVLTGPEAP
jgi:16S rRNA (adenine1518-N6/adenine1519-N6)-dimethyltransferase